MKIIRPAEKSIRNEMINIIRSINVPYASQINDQDYIILLRNMPPSDREDYAKKLFDKKLITKAELSEFSFVKK
jgi:hypothetical protein